MFNKGLSKANRISIIKAFAKEIKVGDVIFVKKGIHQIIGRGVVESGYIYDPAQPNGYNNVRKVNWTHNGVWQHPGQAVLKTLTDIMPYTKYVETIKFLFGNAQGEKIEVFNFVVGYTEVSEHHKNCCIVVKKEVMHQFAT